MSEETLTMNGKCLLCDKEQPVGVEWAWYEPENLDFGYSLCQECDKLSVADRRKRWEEKQLSDKEEKVIQ